MITSEDPESRPTPGASEEPQEIEILEIVGLDERRAPPAAPAGSAETGAVSGEAGAREDGGPEETGSPHRVADREVEALRERILRIQADFENLTRRVERERDEHDRHATGALVARLLSVLDNLERAIEAGRRSTGNDSLLEGVVMVRRHFLEELRREGLRPLDAVGQPFDPKLHEAVATGADAGLPHGAVLEEFRRGYRFHDRLLRPALVRVNVHGGDAGGPGELGEES